MKIGHNLEFVGGAKILGISLDDLDKSPLMLRIIKANLKDEYYFFSSLQDAIDFAATITSVLEKIIIFRKTIEISTPLILRQSIQFDCNNYGLLSSVAYFDYIGADASASFTFSNVNTRYIDFCNAIAQMQAFRNPTTPVVPGVEPFPIYTPTDVPYTDKIKGIYYVPRLSKDNFWLTNWANGEFTDADILDDFDTMKALLGINTIRIFTFYDIEYRKNPSSANLVGLTDGKGNYNEALFSKLSRFIDLAKMAGLSVLPTLFQELKALRATDDWSFLESDLSYYKEFTEKIIRLFSQKSNVQYVMLKNEPDGYGVWNDVSLASRVLTFLYEIKKSALSVSTKIKYLVNSVTHDNIFKKYPNSIANSIYKLTDVVCCNSFLWTDTGYWSGVNYRTQIDYLFQNDTLDKGIIITECGFPTNYISQRVAGYADENGLVSTVTDESTIPINDAIFDRPFGRAVGVAHTEMNQSNAIAEAAYWVQKKKLKGFLVWSAFDHDVTAIRDSFAVINFDKSPKIACEVIKATFLATIASDFGNRISLQQGSIAGTGVINGLVGNSAGVDGLRVNGNSNWISEELLYDYPFSYAFELKYLNDTDEPFTLGIVTNETAFQLRYKKYDKNAFELYDLGNNVSLGWCTALNLQPNTLYTIDIEMKGSTPNFFLNNSALTFGGALNVQPYQLNNIRAQLFGIQSAVELKSLYATGQKGDNISVLL